MLPYLRVMERLCAFYNIILQIRFVKGVDNPVADTISRLQDSKMCAELRAIFPEVMMCARLREVFPRATIFRSRVSCQLCCSYEVCDGFDSRLYRSG